ncbi:MAG: hypothetical protein DMF85_03370 [Acidobacteria bacterium]|nr:MAG: hypothetical protein DMF85_03370 [Acidobacteriota bacterium]
MQATQETEFLAVLNNGNCEPLKAAVHGLVLMTAALCALYNGAAWLRRRERHLAVNTVVYSAAACWETLHVRHHLGCRPATAPAATLEATPLPAHDCVADAA